jgi:tetratricopeptide (TPR) repeat protein
VASPEAYRAPERPLGPAADLYAVAVLTYEVLTMKLPSPPMSESAILAEIADAHPGEPPEHMRPVARILARALARDPASRHRSAAEFRDALLEAQRPSVGAARRRRATTTVALLVAAAATVYVAVRPGASRFDAPADSRGVGPAMNQPTQPVPVSTATVPPAMTSLASAAGSSDLRVSRPAGSAESPAHALLTAALKNAWLPKAIAREQSAHDAIESLDSENLDARNAILARGVIALARLEYPSACAAFDSALAMREDYDAYMGAGECRLRDSLVVADSAGAPYFRSSYYAAARAYVEAARHAAMAGVAFANERLADVAYTEMRRVRRGWTTDGRLYLGSPVGVADSFTFEPRLPGPSRMTPEVAASGVRAVAIARQMLRPSLLAWSRRQPDNAHARELLVELLEASGNVREPGVDGLTAYQEVADARKVPMNSHAALSMAHLQVRILLRSREFARAARLADSILAASGDDDSRDDELLVSLAFLTGKVGRGARLLERVSGSPSRQIRLPDGHPVGLSPAMIRERASFVAASALGVCDENVRRAPERLAGMLDVLFPRGARPRGVEQGFLEDPLVLAATCVGSSAAGLIREPSNPVAGVLLATNDEDRATWLSRFSATASRGTSGVNTSSALSEAQVLLLQGDSLAAYQRLQRVLTAIPALPNVFLNNEVLAGTLTRSMALGARLAVAVHQDADAIEWAQDVAALWSNADPELQPVVDEMADVRERAGRR